MLDTERLTTTQYWDQYWLNFVLPYRVDVRHSYRWLRYDQLLHRLLSAGRKRFLEVGCGASEWLVYFHENFGYDVAGLDNSSTACDVSRRNLELTKTPGTIFQGDILDENLEIGKFDVILSIGVIEHFDDPRLALQKIARFLAPGGVLITTIPNFAGWFGIARRITDPTIFAMHKRITRGGLEGYYKGLGLEDIYATYFGSFRFPYISAKDSKEHVIKFIGRLISRPFDRLLTSCYRSGGWSLEGPWLSSEIYAVGRRT